MLDPLVQGILAYLESAEQYEGNLHFQDDIRIAWLTVLHSARDDCLLCSPHVWATYMVLGLHPDAVWPAIVAHRKALLGPLYEEFYGVELPPKKPARSVTLPQRKAA